MSSSLTNEQTRDLANTANTAIVQLGPLGIICTLLIGFCTLFVGAMTWGVWQLSSPLIEISVQTKETAAQTKETAGQTKDILKEAEKTTRELTDLREMEQARQLVSAQNQKTFEDMREALNRLNDKLVISANDDHRKLSLK